MARIEDILLYNLKTGKTVFKYVPEDIGEIIYCDSTNPKEKPDTKDQVKTILSIIIPLTLAICWCLYFWIVFNDFPFMNYFIIIILGILSIYFYRKFSSFKGTDYFVGTEGTALISFNKTRDNITSNIKLYFRDFVDLIIFEIRNYISEGSKRYYDHTLYKFTIYGQEKDDKKEVLSNIHGTYKQENTDEYYADHTFRYLKKIEQSWSVYKFALIKQPLMNGLPIGFNRYNYDGNIVDYILFHGEQLIVGQTILNKSNIINQEISNGHIYIEYKNNALNEDSSSDECLRFKLDSNGKSKLVGTYVKDIPLASVGNCKIFLSVFNNFVSKLNIPQRT